MANRNNKSSDAIVVSNLHKSFKLPHEQHSGIKQAILSAFKQRKNPGYENQHVLKGVSFTIKKGEFFGIVGRNGSGKSTLLKLLAGIYVPDSGTIQINGSLTPFIELGVGFNPELTGRENVFLNGALLGFSRNEMDTMYDYIVEFAELERFMDQKLKNYSSGMQVRLAFSIAIRARSDILLLDEVLAVGDEAFQRKCFEYFAELRKNKQTIVLVTHDMDSVNRFCDRAVLIDKGSKTIIGTPRKIAQIYKELNDKTNVTVNAKKDDSKKGDNSPEARGTKYVDVEVEYKNNKKTLDFSIKIIPKQDLPDPIVALEIFKDNGEPLIRWVTDEQRGVDLKLNKGKSTIINLQLDNVFPVGTFAVRVLVRKIDRSVDYGVFNDVATFDIRNMSQYKYNNLWKPNTIFSIGAGEVDGSE